jgi:hypothetical protein
MLVPKSSSHVDWLPHLEATVFCAVFRPALRFGMGLLATKKMRAPLHWCVLVSKSRTLEFRFRLDLSLAAHLSKCVVLVQAVH